MIFLFFINKNRKNLWKCITWTLYAKSIDQTRHNNHWTRHLLFRLPIQIYIIRKSIIVPKRFPITPEFFQICCLLARRRLTSCAWRIFEHGLYHKIYYWTTESKDVLLENSCKAHFSFDLGRSWKFSDNIFLSCSCCIIFFFGASFFVCIMDLLCHRLVELIKETIKRKLLCKIISFICCKRIFE